MVGLVDRKQYCTKPSVVLVDRWGFVVVVVVLKQGTNTISWTVGRKITP